MEAVKTACCRASSLVAYTQVRLVTFSEQKMSDLKKRLKLERCPLEWAQNLVVEHHYLHRRVHPLGLPFAYKILLEQQAIGTIIMATPHFTKLRGLFGYTGLPTQWQVLQLSRFWLAPSYQSPQSNGHANNLASCALAQLLKRVNNDWLNHHPPRFPSQPHHLELILAYADRTVGHRGTIYRAANFREFGCTNSNRQRHGKGNNQGEKILYVYFLDKKRPVNYPIQLSLFEQGRLCDNNASSPSRLTVGDRFGLSLS